jgi:hypothetical protein
VKVQIPENCEVQDPSRSKKMSRSKLLMFVILSSLTGAAVGIFAGVGFVFSESNFSPATVYWNYRFQRALGERGEARLGDLVSFEWDMIYFLEPYDLLDTEREAELFPTVSRLGSFSWRGDVRFWTIAYQRPGRSPFLIKLRKNEWNLRGLTNRASTDPDAKLRLVPSNTIEATYCTRPQARCLTLFDSRSKFPIEPLK